MTAESHVHDAFLAALMLTGAVEAAECAVSNAIARSGSAVSSRELLVATASYAIQLDKQCLPKAKVPLRLPFELERLFLLPPVGRKCFVLRMLAGLTREVSSEILKLREYEVDEALCAALDDLVRVDTVPRRQESDSDCGLRRRQFPDSPEVSRP
jgi:hypothetical protein